MPRGESGGSGIGSSSGSSQTAHELRGKQKRSTGGGLHFRPRKAPKPGRAGGQGNPMGYQTLLSRQSLMILMK